MTIQRTAFLTGVTGFIGSSLAAALLAEGRRVITLSRRDPEGKKTQAMVRRAAHTLGISLSDAVLASCLTTISGALEDASSLLQDYDLSDVDTVWHLAANLSYAAKGLARSLEVNLNGAIDCYRLFADKAPRCRRFYHVSTAYTFGFPRPEEKIPESLHACPRLPNAYQLSKWGAEVGLREATSQSRLPVTVLRPSVVVGNSETGVYHGDPFGMYMFLSAVHPLINFPGFRDLRLPRETNGSVNLIPIDVLVDNWLALDAGDSVDRPVFDVIHCTGQAVPAALVAQTGGEVTGLRVSFEGPRSALDQIFAARVKENHIFMAHRFHFEEQRLPSLLGSRFRATAIDETSMRRMIAVYLRRLDRERGQLSIPALFRPFLSLITQSRSNLGPAVAHFLTRGYSQRVRAAAQSY